MTKLRPTSYLKPEHFRRKMAKLRPTSYLKREHFRRKLAKSTPTSYFKREHFRRQLRESVQSRPTSSSKREQFLASISVDAAETDSFQRSRTVTQAFFKRYFKKMTYSKRSVLSCSTIKPTDHDVAKHQQKRPRASRGLSGGSFFLGLKDPPPCIHLYFSVGYSEFFPNTPSTEGMLQRRSM